MVIPVRRLRTGSNSVMQREEYVILRCRRPIDAARSGLGVVEYRHWSGPAGACIGRSWVEWGPNRFSNKRLAITNKVGERRYKPPAILLSKSGRWESTVYKSSRGGLTPVPVPCSTMAHVGSSVLPAFLDAFPCSNGSLPIAIDFSHFSTCYPSVSGMWNRRRQRYRLRRRRGNRT